MAVSDAFEVDGQAVQVELAKGLGYITLTGICLFFGGRFLMTLIANQYAEIEKQRRSIESLNQRASAGLLASAIGHDANNLLTAARMSVDMLKRGADPLKMESMLTNIEEALNELTQLNRRLVRGGNADQPGKLQPRCLKHESERVLQFIDGDHPIGRLQVEIVCNAEVTAPVNRHLYFQVLLNLLLNVTRHAGAESFVRITIIDCGEIISVAVEDDGPGVAADDREIIFKPYYSKHPEGSGLGLASARAIMNLHGGDIRCQESELGGAKFLLSFPKEPALPDKAVV